MDGEDLKILGSPITRYCSIKEDPDRVGFLGRISTGFLTRQGLVLATGGLLTAGLDKIDLTKLELVPTLFGFLTTWFLAGLDMVGLGFLRGAMLCAEGEGSRSPIDDRVVRF
jgi:hypothetical protein